MDLQAARVLSGKARLRELASFHYQQAAEKALKAVLVAARRSVPRVHDLVLLAREASSVAPELRRATAPARRLNMFYIETRYPVGPQRRLTAAELSGVMRAATTIVEMGRAAVRAVRGESEGAG